MRGSILMVVVLVLASLGCGSREDPSDAVEGSPSGFPSRANPCGQVRDFVARSIGVAEGDQSPLGVEWSFTYAEELFGEEDDDSHERFEGEYDGEIWCFIQAQSPLRLAEVISGRVLDIWITIGSDHRFSTEELATDQEVEFELRPSGDSGCVEVPMADPLDHSIGYSEFDVEQYDEDVGWVSTGGPISGPYLATVDCHVSHSFRADELDGLAFSLSVSGEVYGQYCVLEETVILGEDMRIHAFDGRSSYYVDGPAEVEACSTSTNSLFVADPRYSNIGAASTALTTVEREVQHIVEGIRLPRVLVD